MAQQGAGQGNVALEVADANREVGGGQFEVDLLGGGSRQRELEVVAVVGVDIAQLRSEERRVGKECRSRWSPYH